MLIKHEPEETIIDVAATTIDTLATSIFTYIPLIKNEPEETIIAVAETIEDPLEEASWTVSYNPLACVFCDWTGTKSGRVYHMINIHDKFTCDQCSYSSEYAINVDRHKKSVSI